VRLTGTIGFGEAIQTEAKRTTIAVVRCMLILLMGCEGVAKCKLAGVILESFVVRRLWAQLKVLRALLNKLQNALYDSSLLA